MLLVWLHWGLRQELLVLLPSSQEASNVMMGINQHPDVSATDRPRGCGVVKWAAGAVATLTGTVPEGPISRTQKGHICDKLALPIVPLLAAKARCTTQRAAGQWPLSQSA